MTVRLEAETVERLRIVLRRAQRLLLVSGVLLLGYCAFVLADAWIFQERQSQELIEHLGAETAALPPSESAAAAEPAPMVSVDGRLGRLEIPRLGLSTIVVEGVGTSDLRLAVGHIPGTAFPGERGNVGIAGHRDTHFRALAGIQQDDLITLTTSVGDYNYRVVSSLIVSPNAVEVLDPTGDDVLTLVTCYPFYYVGPAPNRFIVRAQRM